jgi:hypothetical protein
MDEQAPKVDEATSSMGAIALVLFILGILGPIALTILGDRVPIQEEHVPLVAIACEALALVLGIASWSDARGRVAAIGAGLIAAFALVTFTGHARMRRDREDQRVREEERMRDEQQRMERARHR